jgi:hypothetical protein
MHWLTVRPCMYFKYVHKGWPLQDAARSIGLQRLDIRTLVAITMSRRLSKSEQLADWQQQQLCPACALTSAGLSVHTFITGLASATTHKYIIP